MQQRNIHNDAYGSFSLIYYYNYPGSCGTKIYVHYKTIVFIALIIIIFYL